MISKNIDYPELYLPDNINETKDIAKLFFPLWKMRANKICDGPYFTKVKFENPFKSIGYTEKPFASRISSRNKPLYSNKYPLISRFLSKLISNKSRLTVIEKIELHIDEKKHFTPDITLLSSDGYIFDIEIDEPYSHSSGRPTHYLSVSRATKETVSIDNFRNLCFTNRHWIVIRFSEEQIIKYPDDCIDYIYEINDSVNRKTITETNISFKYPAQKWNRKQAVEMANSKYRESYLPADYKFSGLPEQIISSAPNQKEEDIGVVITSGINTKLSNELFEISYESEEEAEEKYGKEKVAACFPDIVKTICASSSATENAVQNGWDVFCEFPVSNQVKSNTLEEYISYLYSGKIIYKNEIGAGVFDSYYYKEEFRTLFIILRPTKDNEIPCSAIMSVDVRNNLFYHHALEVFYNEEDKDAAIDHIKKYKIK